MLIVLAGLERTFADNMSTMRVGVISDTHGLLRPEALGALQGSDVIIHAGDIGKADVIEHLREVAPTFAVRGNNDTGSWAAAFPVSRVVEVGEVSFYVLHEVSRLDLEPAAAGFAAVVSGHSHRPSIQFRQGILYLNPGSAGPRRFTLPVTVARVDVSGNEVRPEIVELPVRSGLTRERTLGETCSRRPGRGRPR